MKQLADLHDNRTNFRPQQLDDVTRSDLLRERLHKGGGIWPEQRQAPVNENQESCGTLRWLDVLHITCQRTIGTSLNMTWTIMSRSIVNELPIMATAFLLLLNLARVRMHTPRLDHGLPFRHSRIEVVCSCSHPCNDVNIRVHVCNITPVGEAFSIMSSSISCAT